jgi:hypothetical protein
VTVLFTVLALAVYTPTQPLEGFGVGEDMTRKFEYNWNVAKWLGDVEIEVKNVPPAVVLALIHVESSGDPFARKSSKSQFFGLLQAGRGVGIDVGMRDLGVNTTKNLHGNGPLALRTFSALVNRYESVTLLNGKQDPKRVALLWKAGVGFTGDVNALCKTGVPWDEAIDMVADLKGFSPKEYLEWFHNAYDVWSERTVCGPA